MANKYSTAYAVLLNNGSKQILPVSKAQLIELAAEYQNGQFGSGAKNVSEALSYLLTKGNTDLEAAKTYTATSIEALDSNITAGTGYVLSGIDIVDGKLTSSYTREWLDASNISYNGDSNVESALTNIYSQLAAIAGDGDGSISDQISDAIEALAYDTAGTANKPVVAVTQENGVIAPVQGNIDAQYVNVDNTTLGWDIDGNDGADTDVTVQSAITYLQSEINGLGDSAKQYQLTTVTSGLSNNIKERKQLQVKAGESGSWTDVANSYVDVYKDSALLAAGLSTMDATWDGSAIQNGTGEEALVLVYEDKNGQSTVVPINVSDFLKEAEAGNGLAIDENGVLNVVKDAESENFLTVNANSIAVTGVQDAIYSAVNTYVGGLDSEIEAKTEGVYSYVMTGVTETDGKLTAATYIGLTDENVKTTFADGDAMRELSSDKTSYSDIADVKGSLNTIASNISNLTTGTLGNIIITDGTYVKATNATKNGTAYSFTIDDSSLGNVATLQYDVLSQDAEVVTILNANPETT